VGRVWVMDGGEGMFSFADEAQRHHATKTFYPRPLL
jgi:hypothetical protein